MTWLRSLRAGASRRWRATPLRTRLVLGLMLITSVALLAVAAATAIGLRSWLTGQIDDSLVNARDEAIEHANNPGTLSDTVRNWYSPGSVALLYSTDGTVRQFTIRPDNDTTPQGSVSRRLTQADLNQLAQVPTAAGSEPITVDLEQLGDYRVIGLRLNDGGLLVGASPLKQVNDVIGRLVVVEIFVLVFALLLVWLLGSWAIRLSLRPLRRVADTASGVAALPLDRGDVVITERVPEAPITTEVGQVSAAFNAMLDHVEDSLQTRQETEDRLRRFVSDAGHELRTPLAAVRGYAELVRRAGDAHPGQARESAQRIESSAQRMGVLVEDLLLLASLDEGRQLEVAPVDMGQVLDDALAEARAVGPDHEWIVRIEDASDTIVDGDRQRLHQVLANLLSNARLHTPAGTTVTSSVARVDDVVVVVVADNGPGIPDELLANVTERFTRHDGSRTRATGGTGLGMAIVEAIVQAHGGTLSVSNDGGARIEVRLPAADEANTDVQTSEHSTALASGPDNTKSPTPDGEPATS